MFFVGPTLLCRLLRDPVTVAKDFRIRPHDRNLSDHFAVVLDYVLGVLRRDRYPPVKVCVSFRSPFVTWGVHRWVEEDEVESTVPEVVKNRRHLRFHVPGDRLVQLSVSVACVPFSALG